MRIAQRGNQASKLPSHSSFLLLPRAGLSIIRALSPLGYTIRALTRTPTTPLFTSLPNVHPTFFDYSDLGSVQTAFEGADVVYGLTLADSEVLLGFKEEKMSGMMSEEQQGRRLVDVAGEKGVKLFFW